MHPILRRPLPHPPARIRQRRVIIQIHQPLPRAELLEPPIQRPNLLRRLQPGLPRVVIHRQNRRQHHPNAVRLRHRRHRAKVVLHHLRRLRPRIPRDIIRPRQNHHHPRPQPHYILLKPHQHLRRRLPADPPIHIRLPREKAPRVLPPPPRIRDRIAKKHHPALPLARCLQPAFSAPYRPSPAQSASCDRSRATCSGVATAALASPRAALPCPQTPEPASTKAAHAPPNPIHRRIAHTPSSHPKATPATLADLHCTTCPPNREP